MVTFDDFAKVLIEQASERESVRERERERERGRGRERERERLSVCRRP